MALIETFIYTLQAQDVRWLNARAQSVLNADERVRWQRFRVAQAQNVFLASRFLLRRVLSSRLQCTPAQVQFGFGEHGKPFVSAPSTSWHFNLSHSGEHILLAVAQGLELGVDIEQRRPSLAFGELAERVLSPQELLRFGELEHEAQEDYFYRVWVLKESYLKLLGTGIWHGLERIVTDVDRPSYVSDAAVCARYISHHSSYCAAIAYHLGAVPVEVRLHRLDHLRNDID